MLPFGVAALIVATMVYLQESGRLGDLQLFSNWEGVVYWFAGLSVVSVGLLKLFFQKKADDRQDINEY